MHIHARGLLYFDAIRRNGSIRGAARQLFIDASAVNRQLIQLEQELGLPLFERLGSGLQLTPAGELFARHATHVLQDAEWLENELDMLRGLQRGKVHVVGVESLHGALLPEVIGTMLERHPGISLQVSSASSGHIADYVASGRADVGMAFDMPQHEDVAHAASGRFRLGALVAAGHPLARRRSVTLAQCTPWPFILGTEDLASYALIQGELGALPAPPRAVVRATSVELMKRLAAAGHGIAFQTRLGLEATASAATPAARFVPLESAQGVPILGTLGIHVRSGRSLPPATAAFVECASQVIQRLAAQETRPKRR
ncbi:LysR family transcriptional regulator [Comamonas sp. w2-DMI]|uniref:LysR family transcriptional regulator n=1 Tax=Comamonas sp. w2-DMI TaxID=3126391 RepID=UPI0032E48C2E